MLDQECGEISSGIDEHRLFRSLCSGASNASLLLFSLIWKLHELTIGAMDIV